MTQGDKAAAIARGMEAFGRGDADTLMGTMSDDIVWHLPGSHPLAGDYHGPQAVVEALGQLLARTGGAVEPVDLLVGQDHLMAFTRFTSGGDDPVEVLFADAFRFDGNGSIVEYWSLPGDPEAWDALLS